MKVCILGPVGAPSYYGGVASFDEGLANGLVDLGAEVLVCTEQSDAPNNGRRFGIQAIRSASSLSTAIREMCPDMVIASLAYGKYLLAPWIREGCLKVYYLHGFFNEAHYPRWKVLAGSAFQKLVCSRCDMVVANSAFTAQVNSVKWGIATDAVIAPGVADEYIRPGAGARSGGAGKRVLYLGRLHEAKRVDALLRAFAVISRKLPGASLCVAGDGPHADRLKSLAHELGCRVDFSGRVQGDGARRLYARSDVFVSLNESEPFGITYCEALLSGCRIVCPAKGGQVEFLSGREGRVTLCEDVRPETVASAILRLLDDSRELPPIANPDWFSYKRVARDFLSLADERVWYDRRCPF